MLLATPLIFFIASPLFLHVVSADDSPCTEEFSVLNNDRGDTPCVVAQNLRSPCNETSATQEAKSECSWSPRHASRRIHILPRAVVRESAKALDVELSLERTQAVPSDSRAPFWSSNTIVYNLASACALCTVNANGSSIVSGDTSGLLPPFSDWTSACTAPLIVSWIDYPLHKILDEARVPKWAFNPLTSDKMFNLSRALQMSESWTTIQILAPIIVGIVLLFACTISICYGCKRRRGYTPFCSSICARRVRHVRRAQGWDIDGGHPRRSKDGREDEEEVEAVPMMTRARGVSRSSEPSRSGGAARSESNRGEGTRTQFERLVWSMRRLFDRRMVVQRRQASRAFRIDSDDSDNEEDKLVSKKRDQVDRLHGKETSAESGLSAAAGAGAMVSGSPRWIGTLGRTMSDDSDGDPEAGQGHRYGGAEDQVGGYALVVTNEYANAMGDGQLPGRAGEEGDLNADDPNPNQVIIISKDGEDFSIHTSSLLSGASSTPRSTRVAGSMDRRSVEVVPPTPVGQRENPSTDSSILPRETIRTPPIPLLSHPPLSAVTSSSALAGVSMKGPTQKLMPQPPAFPILSVSAPNLRETQSLFRSPDVLNNGTATAVAHANEYPSARHSPRASFESTSASRRYAPASPPEFPNNAPALHPRTSPQHSPSNLMSYLPDLRESDGSSPSPNLTANLASSSILISSSSPNLVSNMTISPLQMFNNSLSSPSLPLTYLSPSPTSLPLPTSANTQASPQLPPPAATLSSPLPPLPHLRTSDPQNLIPAVVRGAGYNPFRDGTFVHQQ
ncbi:hypothetical protein EW146_g2368 [Bondarzewia mesenterica]|uniref:Uncharacterized protein n=1 Tax=Bondarzewia mesenterica TaxID=1095465 RepID=A0A4S4M119_9AGAM|nr:hypothetical protein EW146_g2368 [Bondarzewia mesenterica]